MKKQRLVIGLFICVLFTCSRLDGQTGFTQLEGRLDTTNRNVEFRYNGKAYKASRSEFFDYLESKLVENGFSYESVDYITDLIRKTARGEDDSGPTHRPHKGDVKGKPYAVLTMERDNDTRSLNFEISESEESFERYKKVLVSVQNRDGGGCMLINNGCIKCAPRIYCLIVK